MSESSPAWPVTTTPAFRDVQLQQHQTTPPQPRILHPHESASLPAQALWQQAHNTCMLTSRPQLLQQLPRPITQPPFQLQCLLNPPHQSIAHGGGPAAPAVAPTTRAAAESVTVLPTRPSVSILEISVAGIARLLSSASDAAAEQRYQPGPAPLQVSTSTGLLTVHDQLPTRVAQITGQLVEGAAGSFKPYALLTFHNCTGSDKLLRVQSRQGQLLVLNGQEVKVNLSYNPPGKQLGSITLVEVDGHTLGVSACKQSCTVKVKPAQTSKSQAAAKPWAKVSMTRHLVVRKPAASNQYQCKAPYWRQWDSHWEVGCVALYWFPGEVLPPQPDSKLTSAAGMQCDTVHSPGVTVLTSAETLAANATTATTLATANFVGERAAGAATGTLWPFCMPAVPTSTTECEVQPEVHSAFLSLHSGPAAEAVMPTYEDLGSVAVMKEKWEHDVSVAPSGPPSSALVASDDESDANDDKDDLPQLEYPSVTGQALPRNLQPLDDTGTELQQRLLEIEGECRAAAATATLWPFGMPAVPASTTECEVQPEVHSALLSLHSGPAASAVMPAHQDLDSFAWIIDECKHGVSVAVSDLPSWALIASDDDSDANDDNDDLPQLECPSTTGQAVQRNLQALDDTGTELQHRLLKVAAGLFGDNSLQVYEELLPRLSAFNTAQQAAGQQPLCLASVREDWFLRRSLLHLLVSRVRVWGRGGDETPTAVMSDQTRQMLLQLMCRGNLRSLLDSRNRNEATPWFTAAHFCNLHALEWLISQPELTLKHMLKCTKRGKLFYHITSTQASLASSPEERQQLKQGLCTMLKALANRLQLWIDRQTPEQLQHKASKLILARQQRKQRCQSRAWQEAAEDVGPALAPVGVVLQPADAAEGAATAPGLHSRQPLQHSHTDHSCALGSYGCREDVRWWLSNYAIFHTQWQSMRPAPKSPPYDGQLLEEVVSELFGFQPRHKGD